MVCHSLWTLFQRKEQFTEDFIFIQDDPQLHDYNVPERVQTFIQAANNEASICHRNTAMKRYFSSRHLVSLQIKS